MRVVIGQRGALLWLAVILLGSLGTKSASAQLSATASASFAAQANAAQGMTGAADDDPRVFLRPLQEDASLADVCFVDAQTGWAVGDRGVIWHTADGGQTWTLQNSGVTCRLESVQFVDAQNGWVAGGVYQPYTHTSVGVLLRTRDGGRTWQPDRAALLPALRHEK